MAQIVLISEHINATSWQLAQALISQQHDVTLLTSYGESVENNSNIQIMAYFKKWSLLEAVRLLPRLLALQPQIVHLLLEEDRLNAAQILLSTFAKSHPSAVLTTSLLNIRKGLTRQNPARYLIEESDIVTCPTVEALGHLRGLNVRSNRQGRGILPPVLDLNNQNSMDVIEGDNEARLFMQLEGEKYFMLPFREASFNPESEYFQRLKILVSKHRVVLWGSYSHWSLRERKKMAAWMDSLPGGNRWQVTGDIPLHISRPLLRGSEAFVLAGQSFSPVEMTEYYLRAIQAKATLLLDSVQAGVHSDLWKNGENCWILEESYLRRDLLKLLARPHLGLPESLSEQLAEDRQVMDNSLNELNRLYTRALTQKTWF